MKPNEKKIQRDAQRLVNEVLKEDERGIPPGELQPEEAVAKLEQILKTQSQKIHDFMEASEMFDDVPSAEEISTWPVEFMGSGEEGDTPDDAYPEGAATAFCDDLMIILMTVTQKAAWDKKGQEDFGDLNASLSDMSDPLPVGGNLVVMIKML